MHPNVDIPTQTKRRGFPTRRDRTQRRVTTISVAKKSERYIGRLGRTVSRRVSCRDYFGRYGVTLAINLCREVVPLKTSTTSWWRNRIVAGTWETPS